MKNLHISIVSALLILALAVPAMAQPGAGRGPGPDGFLQNLPQEKQELVKSTMDAMRKNHFELMQQLRVKRIQLEALIVDPKAEQAKIDVLTDEIGAMKTRMFKDRVAAERKIFLDAGVLLPMGRDGRGHGGKGGPCPGGRN